MAIASENSAARPAELLGDRDLEQRRSWRGCRSPTSRITQLATRTGVKQRRLGFGHRQVSGIARRQDGAPPAPASKAFLCAPAITFRDGGEGPSVDGPRRTARQRSRSRSRCAMTDLLFRDDAYLAEADATVHRRRPRGRRARPHALLRQLRRPARRHRPASAAARRHRHRPPRRRPRPRPAPDRARRRAAGARARRHAPPRLGAALPADADAQRAAPAVGGAALRRHRRLDRRGQGPARLRHARAARRRRGARGAAQRLRRGRAAGRARNGSARRSSRRSRRWSRR